MIALLLITGESAVEPVPPKSPANFNLPFTVEVASGVAAITADVTKAVLAIVLLLLFSALGSGVVGTPDNSGDANGAFNAKSAVKLVTSD